jgi:hypothetical protein
MAFAGVNCHNEAGELAPISWRITRLTQVMSLLDFGGPAPHVPGRGELGSGDALSTTMRMTAAALSGMGVAPLAAANPLREHGEATEAGHALIKAAAALQEAAKDADALRAMANS